MRKRHKNLLSDFCVFCAFSRQNSNGDALLADLNSYRRKFPDLEREDLLACIQFAAETLKLKSHHLQLA